VKERKKERKKVHKVVIIIIIQFNSILYYLCAESTAVRPITDTVQCTYNNNNKQLFFGE
jgi:hypothetical protein